MLPNWFPNLKRAGFHGPPVLSGQPPAAHSHTSMGADVAWAVFSRRAATSAAWIVTGSVALICTLFQRQA